MPDRDRLDEQQIAQLDALRDALRDLIVLAQATHVAPDELDRVLQALRPDARPAAAGGDSTPASIEDGTASASSTLWELAQQAGEAERALLRTLPA